MNSQVIVGDCLDVLKTFEANAFGAIVTDPPYHLKASKLPNTTTISTMKHLQ